MLVETFTVGMLSTNCYVASSKGTKEAIIIDPGIDLSSEAEPILDYIAVKKLNLKFIVNTHGHDDHIKGDAFFQKKFNVPICIHRLDEHFIEDLEKDSFLPNLLFKDGSLIKVGNETLKVLHTPGHTHPEAYALSMKNLFSQATHFLLAESGEPTFQVVP
jgi:hydroxyacylglutathione hydrolase